MPIVRYRQDLLRRPKGFCTLLSRDIMARAASEAGLPVSDLFEVLADDGSLHAYIRKNGPINRVIHAPEDTPSKTAEIKQAVEVKKRRGRPKRSRQRVNG